MILKLYEDIAKMHEWKRCNNSEHRCSCGGLADDSWIKSTDVARSDYYCRSELNACNRALNEYAAKLRTPRFIFKSAEEMAEGEPTVCRYGDSYSPETLRVQCELFNSGNQKGVVNKWGASCPFSPAWAIVDTHASDWQAFQSKLQASKSMGVGSNCTAVGYNAVLLATNVAIVAPPFERASEESVATQATLEESADIAIVEAWEDAGRCIEEGEWGSSGSERGQQWEGSRRFVRYTQLVIGKLSSVTIEGLGSTSLEQYQHARRRELARRQSKVRELERLRVVCEDQYKL